MNVYYVTPRHDKWPGTIIVAGNRSQAFNLLKYELAKKGSLLDYRDINPRDFIQLDMRIPHAVILTSE